MKGPKKISDFTTVAPRYQRSISLQNDWNQKDAASGYIVTANVLRSFEQVVFGLKDPHGQKSFALTGPYGSGKSSFAVFLCQLLGFDSELAQLAIRQLPKNARELCSAARELRKSESGSDGFISIPVTARRRPIAQVLLEEMIAALDEYNVHEEVQLIRKNILKSLEREEWSDTAVVMRHLASMTAEAARQKIPGILLVVDEAGKTLEYALQDRSGGDVYLFQELAEFANRQKDISLLFLITLHQMFDDYVELSDRTLRNEWNKVQERFQTIQFSEPATSTIQMVASALQPSSERPRDIDVQIKQALDVVIEAFDTLPVGLDEGSFRQASIRGWPMHPSTLLVLPYLFRRLAQNERSIFSYLTSHEPFGFQDHLDKSFELKDSFVHLYHLYTYFLSNFEAGLARLPHAKRLLEANDIIMSRHQLTPRQYQILQTVALFNVLSEISPMRATPKAIGASLDNPSRIEQELEELRTQSILTYRKLDGSYRIWEGSDVDLEARMIEARRKLKMENVTPLEGLCEHLPRQHWVARRHSLETGAIRCFAIQYASTLDAKKLPSILESEEVDGTIFVLLPEIDSKRQMKQSCDLTQRYIRLIIAIPRQIEALRGVVEELACLRWVETNTEELRDDRIARRELSLRITTAEQRVSQLLQTLLDPRPPPYGNSCQWIWAGKDQKPRKPVEVTRLLSKACDMIYPQTPRLKNELVVRKKISGAATSARRILLEKMLNDSEHERLGIEGFPPERSVYESVLRAGGIHAFDAEKSCWTLQAPPVDNPVNLRPCWDCMEQTIFQSQMERVRLPDLFRSLSDAPYGLAEGVHPILFSAFYLVYQDELFLYREDSFIPDVQAAHLELLQRRPDLFSVSGARLDGTRKALVRRLAKGLRQTPKTASVVRALYRMLNSLPPVTQKTSLIEEEAVKNMRDCLLQAASPEKLLFSELPACFEIESFREGESRDHDMDLFFEKLNHALGILNSYAQNLLEEKRDVLLQACGIETGEEGWRLFTERTTWLAPRIKHEVLTPFLNCVNNGIDDHFNVHPTLSLVSNRPFEQWTDMDSQSFDGLAKGVGELFQNISQNYGVSHSYLSKEDLLQKEAFRLTLEPQIKKLSSKDNNLALAAALRDILSQIESN
ncbi:MAG: hypothetical protein JJU29_23615 [Verrucomicrobia bacterium]|nr:hypothetical protein [Verrucomicrobiota bacterium]MCH8510352.1 hypothetical protein [Kiritimatiellia bacterium]